MKIESSKPPDSSRAIYTLTPSEKIATRNNWLKIGVIGALTLVTVVKVWQSDFSNILTGFDFSDLLSLFLAMFSIALAVLFYLKATDTSNVFYDNTYRFTKDVSEILGRVEAGFGERLRHLDDGFTGLKTAVEKIPYDRGEADKEIKEEEAQVKKVEEERNKLIETLAERARLQEDEKAELFTRLNASDEELSSARRELSLMRRRMAEHERLQVREGSMSLSPRIHQVLRIITEGMNTNLVVDAPTRIVNREFKNELTKHPDSFGIDLREYGLIDEDMDLTRSGLAALRTVATNKRG